MNFDDITPPTKKGRFYPSIAHGWHNSTDNGSQDSKSERNVSLPKTFSLKNTGEQMKGKNMQNVSKLSATSEDENNKN